MTERETNPERPWPKLLPHLWVLDLDRTILDTNKFVERFTEFLDTFRVVDIGHLRQMQRAAQASGGSFDVISYLKDSSANQVDPLHLDPLLADFVTSAQPDAHQLYEPQARELLDYLDAQEEPYVFMTKGGLEWQGLKIHALDLGHVPRIITDQTDKTAQLAGAYRDGVFVLDEAIGLTGGPVDGIRTNTYTIVDDKVESMRGIDDDPRTQGRVRAIHVLPSDGRELLPSQRGELPRSARRLVGAAGVHSYIASTRT